MPTLNAFLVPKYIGAKSDFGEGDGYFVGLEVVKFLKDAIAGVRAFDNADYWWSGTRGNVGQRDLVCYVFDEIGQSIVIKHSKTQTLQSEVGNTVWSPQAQRRMRENALILLKLLLLMGLNCSGCNPCGFVRRVH